MEELFKRLEYAKKAVKSILEDGNCSVDFHGIAYWAGEVERLRKKLKKGYKRIVLTTLWKEVIQWK